MQPIATKYYLQVTDEHFEKAVRNPVQKSSEMGRKASRRDNRPKTLPRAVQGVAEYYELVPVRQVAEIGTRTTRGEVAESTSGGRLVGLIRMWNATNRRLLRSLTGHTHTVYSLAVSTDGKQLVSGCFDRSVKVRVTSTGKRLIRRQ